MTAIDREYLSCAETAQLVRAALKRAFPACKFSVRSSTYSMGASIRVSWVDGPTTEMVDAIAKQYAGADFDGSIDLKTYSDHYLMPDGSVVFGSTNGTQGSGGFIPAVKNEMPIGARRVHFGADYIFTERSFSTEAQKIVDARTDYHASYVTHGAAQWEIDRDRYRHANHAARELDFSRVPSGGKPVLRPTSF